MLLNEPSPVQSPYEIRFSLFWTPIRVLPWFWLTALLLGIQLRDPKQVFLWIMAVFISVLVHEFGHALLAWRYGWPPEIALLAFGGVTLYRPVNQTPLKNVILTLAGPLAGFLFAGIIALALYLTGTAVPLWVLGYELVIGRGEPLALKNLNLAYFVYFLLFANIYWGLLNLLPIYPLDGGRIAREGFVRFNRRDGLRLSLICSMITAAVVAIYAVLATQSLLMLLLFGFLAYDNYRSLQNLYGSRFW